ncbi:MAG: ABC transporter permease, partial [Eubacteriales bacterium]|nr:ABC transporter permease [Eubacteriales bacterium]
NFVTEATNGAMGAMVSNAALIKKVYVPKYVFPLEKTLFAFVNMLFSSIAVVIIMLVQRFALPWTAVLFFVPMLYTLVFGFGLGLVLSAMNVFFRDTGHLYGVWTTAWLYLTPIIYPVDILPEWMLKIIAWNPLYYYVDYFRQVVMYGTLPGLRVDAICAAFALGFLCLGVIVFKRAQDRFILYI